MRSPRLTSVPDSTHGTMRRAIKPAIRRMPTLVPAGSLASKPISTFSLCVADSVFRALRNWPSVYLKCLTRPPTGAFWTCTLTTERKMEMRWHSPPMKAGSLVIPIASTLP